MSAETEKMAEEVVENLKRPSAWLRLLFMAGFVVALYVTGIILLVLMLAQIFFSLFTGTDNVNIRRMGASLTVYVSQILVFLTYNSEVKPFPFIPFPAPADEVVSTAAESGETADRDSFSKPVATGNTVADE
ncbi:MAG TPA: DUF4389 domain-containing protein [Pseudohongiella sp.]|nr:DUF4389 domain-containing protein [Pseudohongiella sp.]